MARLQCGDNLDHLAALPDGFVQLVYLDPPFDTGENRNASLRTAQRQLGDVQAFADAFEWSDAHEASLARAGEVVPAVGDAVRSLVGLLGRTGRAAYLVMMGRRLEHLRRVLRSDGALYLHCDPNASHHLRLLLDAAFGREGFRNEIVWRRSSGHGNARLKFASVHDVLLSYAAGRRTKWHEQFEPLSPRYVAAFFRHVEERTGRRYRLQNTVNPNRNRPNLTYVSNGHLRTWKWSQARMQELHDQGRLHYSSTGYPQLKQYLDESPGQRVTDVWDDIDSLQVIRSERCGYPTQKPISLLTRIIAAHADEGDLVLDPFCGSGTTGVTAHRLGCDWILQDSSHLAVALSLARLAHEPDPPDVVVEGVPTDLAAAQALLRRDRRAFRWWALSLVRARPAIAERLTGGDELVHGFLQSGGEERPVAVVGDEEDRGKLQAAPDNLVVLALDAQPGEISIADAMMDATRPAAASPQLTFRLRAQG